MGNGPSIRNCCERMADDSNMVETVGETTLGDRSFQRHHDGTAESSLPSTSNYSQPSGKSGKSRRSKAPSSTSSRAEQELAAELAAGGRYPSRSNKSTPSSRDRHRSGKAVTTFDLDGLKVPFPVKPDAYLVVLRQSYDGRKLGLVVAHSDSEGTMKIQAVKKDSVASDWNLKHPTKPIVDGCFVLEINGKDIRSLTVPQIGALVNNSAEVKLLITAEDPQTSKVTVSTRDPSPRPTVAPRVQQPAARKGGFTNEPQNPREVQAVPPRKSVAVLSQPIPEASNEAITPRGRKPKGEVSEEPVSPRGRRR
mmetsp:Transcript_67399/g.161653  ORF Transcript_67399/g.161653 Transcript_67399/m.161653 type:complete len:309 (+) Transcript_67399:58-984(+)